MIKTLTLIFAAMLSAGLQSQHTFAATRIVGNDSSRSATVKISPAKPLIEKDIYGYYLNFDITIKNEGKHVIELSSVEAEVMDINGKLVMRKFMNREGQSSGLELLGTTTIKPGETISIYNPFHTFPADVTINTLKYGFFFDYADNQQQIDNNSHRLSVDYDMAAIKVIKPEVFIAKNNYYLPLKGKLIVWDGHDFYSHNRRKPAADSSEKNIISNSSRYAYDLMSVDTKGSMYKASPFKKQDWFVYGNPVFVPLDGKVVAVQNTIADNEFTGKSVQYPKAATKNDPDGMGNYIIIQHANGEYSQLLHLEKGSISVKRGDLVKAGQQIGKVGFSGDIMYPHLHYTVTNGAKQLASEGVPTYFNDYKLYRGSVTVDIKRSRIDSGDIIESDK